MKDVPSGRRQLRTNKQAKRNSNLPNQPTTSMSIKPPMNAVAQYLMALAAVIACYSGYLKFAVPAIEGPQDQVRRRELSPFANLPSPPEDKSRLLHLLPADAWELTDCKTLLTSSGTILFKQLNPLDNGTIQIVPFTLITGLENQQFADATDAKKQKSSKPIVLRCIEGANLKFDKPVRDVFSGQAKMESAHLKGTVNIFGPPSAPGKNDGIQIRTSDVQVNKQRVYTLEKVVFAFGPNRGSGRNLLIDLAHDPEKQAIPDFGSVNGIRRLELAFIDKLIVDPTSAKKTSQNVPARDSTSGTANQNNLFANNKSPLEITCDGPFVFHVENQIATFHDNVFAQQLDAFKDHLKCEKLTLVFQDKPADEKSESKGAADNQPSPELGSDFELKQLVAEGLPAVMVSRSKSAKFTGDYLSYNAITDQIEGRCLPNHESMVTIVSPDVQIVAKQLFYTNQKDGSLGPLKAVGPGRLLRVGKKDQDEFFATWKNSLVTDDVPNRPGLQRLVIDGQAKIRIGQDTDFRADNLEALIRQSPVRSTDRQGRLTQTWEYLPAKLIASGSISVTTPKLEGSTNHLTATWPENDAPQSDTFSQSEHSSITHHVAYRGTFQEHVESKPRRPSTFQEQVNTRVSSRFQEQQSGYGSFAERSIGQASFEEESKLEKKLKFSGDKVDVRLLTVNEKTQIRDLTVVGNVTIIETTGQTDSSIPAAESLRISGHRLQLTPQSGEDTYRTMVTGNDENLAAVSAREFQLTGKNIHLDQAANKLWVEGNGAMKLNPEMLAQKHDEHESPVSVSPTATANEANKATLKNLDVAWDGGMVFDGIKIYFERNVALTARRIEKNGNQTDFNSQSEGISVQLARPLVFKKLERSKREKNELREIVLVNHVPKTKQVFTTVSNQRAAASPGKTYVVIKNQTLDPAGKIIETRKIAVPQAIVNAESGSLQCKGPGSIATHRWSEPNAKDASDPFGRMGNSKNASGLSFIQINFDGSMNVDSNRRETILSGNIRTVYSPVQNWEEVYDPDNVRRRAPGTVFLTCEKLQLAQWSPRANAKKVNELVATGNAHIQNELFDATADRVSYDQASDWLTIEGTPRTDANLRFKQTPADKNPTHLVAEKIKYRIQDQRTETQGVKNLNINRN